MQNSEETNSKYNDVCCYLYQIQRTMILLSAESGEKEADETWFHSDKSKRGNNIIHNKSLPRGIIFFKPHDPCSALLGES